MAKCAQCQEPFEVGWEVLCLECRLDAGQKPQPNITHHPSEKKACECVCWGHRRTSKAELHHAHQNPKLTP